MAADHRPKLPVQEREERGSRASRRLRRAGLVPGVVYGSGSDGTVAFKADARQLAQVLSAGSAVLDLEVGSGQPRPVIVKEEQRHPVRGELVHVDLLQVDLSEKIQSTVSVELTGVEEAPGVVQGGVLEHITRELAIEALPTDIPEQVLVDVSSLEIAATLPLSEIAPPAGVEFLDDPDETVIATVGAPSEIEAEDEVEEEPKLVGEAGEDAEAGEEGEAAEESEAKGSGDESS